MHFVFFENKNAFCCKATKRFDFTCKIKMSQLHERDTIHREFYSQVGHALDSWNTFNYNTVSIPDGMTFDDFAPTLMLTPSSSYATVCNLQLHMPAPLNQGSTGACVPCSVVNAIQFWYVNTLKQPTNIQRSVLFIYYNARAYKNETNTDAGCSIENAIKGITQIGACSTPLWPFIPANVTVQPPVVAYGDASNFNQIFQTRQINLDLNSIKTALCLQKYPVICGINVYSSYLDYNTVTTGNIPYPAPTEPLIGGHSLLLIGYNDSTQLFNVQNSYGTGWGVLGYGTIPYKYVLNPALTPNDLWIIGNDINILA